MKTPSEYTFSTFQELLDRVPGNRIAECMHEIGIGMAMAKNGAELMYHTAKSLAEADGVTFPEMPQRLIEWPPEFTWIDDGKGDLDVGLKMNEQDEDPIRFIAKVTRTEEQP